MLTPASSADFNIRGINKIFSLIMVCGVSLKDLGISNFKYLEIIPRQDFYQPTSIGTNLIFSVDLIREKLLII